jgi:cohesin complex subunit SA-1/2
MDLNDHELHLTNGATGLTPAVDALATDDNATNRRKSGRVAKKPQLYDPDAMTQGSSRNKRKRTEINNEEIDQEDASDEEDDEDSEEDESESEADPEELKAKKAAGKKGRKPAQKKVKTAKASKLNGAAKKKLPSRPKTTTNGNGKGRTKSVQRSRDGPADLYGESPNQFL